MTNEIGSAAPLAGSATPQPPGGKLGKDEFLKMLVAQMRNQDPLNPMDGQDMAAQLAQFSSLEQLTNIDKGIENLTSVVGGEMLHAMHASSALGMLGRTVLAAGDRVALGGVGPAEVTFNLGGTGARATLRILDDSGREVGSRDLGALPAGRHTVEVGEAGRGLAAGSYRYRVEVANSAGEPVQVATYVRAKIEGVRNGANGMTLSGGGLDIPFGSVIEIGTD